MTTWQLWHPTRCRSLWHAWKVAGIIRKQHRLWERRVPFGKI